ncbi:MAG: hypothetical protein K5682_06085 [Lachnospiraceae bacterium]|nr:hypothetical protein [Lachnospiraceae bacterium]
MALNISSYLSTTKYASEYSVKQAEEIPEALEEVSSRAGVIAPSVSPEEVTSQEDAQEIHEIHEIGDLKVETPKITIQDAELSLSPAKPARTAEDLNGERKEEDISVQSLDMQKAISDMQKDHILHQYQFFVGNKNMPTA